MPLSASVFRRGGPKKELFEVANENVDDEKELDEKLAELEELLHMSKTGRELSAALWRPSLCAAALLKQRKQTARDFGFIRSKRHHLHIEEAVFLMDRGDLLLFIEEAEADAEEEGQGAAGAAAGIGRGGDGRTPRRRQRLLSVQEAMELMVSVGVPLERFLLYSSLSRSGYLIMRHPSRWLLEREEQPQQARDGRGACAGALQIWGSGAWAQCYGNTPSLPGSHPPPPMQQQLAAGAAAGPGSAAAPMDVDALTGTSAAPAAGGDVASVSGQAVAQQQQQQPAAGAAATAMPGGGGSGGGGGIGCRGWWLPAGPGHPHLKDVPEGAFLDQQPPVVVEPRLGNVLHSRLPRLRPLPTLRSALSASPAPAAADVANVEGGAASSSGSGSGSGSAAAAPALAVQLGTPAASAHLVYDVYKPGSFVSRYKGQFPAVHTHIALRSESPPGLAEMAAADAAAAAAAGADSGRPAPVTWAAVLNGDIALYSIGRADLMCLV
ncbi:hypothetical protein GPECTOR_107g148 [Gonium pectorale]|uniref:tRNA-splicing endonuclease subunit Sen54 N-terminal domain-containing protein n=1 Tax=Gonium pectorale TaxID=33097 RepID=A0A150FZI5_GONPE|nr:hypothetical protein GPECTOR_107g148 [Gonium pectorale]|eukprot:KXZ43004.1 hypothetical protein GPECTOR_107g148 [Gonium pectorale]